MTGDLKYYHYKSIGSKFKRKYGKTLKQLAEELKISPSTLSNWDSKGFDIFYEAQELHILKGNKHLTRVWNNLKSRCGNPDSAAYKNYGGRGIKLRLHKRDLVALWVRDKAHLLKKPSIDRIDNNGDYEFSNCRFIEMSHNRQRQNFNLSKYYKKNKYPT